MPHFLVFATEYVTVEHRKVIEAASREEAFEKAINEAAGLPGWSKHSTESDVQFTGVTQWEP